MSFSTVKEEPQEVLAMTAAEVQQLRTAARTWEATPVTANKLVRREIANSIDVMLGTGVRIGELLAIRWDDVDLEAAPPTISIMAAVTAATDGGGMTYQPAPKSETSKRVLYLPAFAADALHRQFAAREFRPRSLTVFPSESGTLRDPSNYRAHFRQVRALAGLDGVTPKTIRKTVTATSYNSDSLDNASQQLGHSEVGVTAKHYVQRLNIGPAGVVGVLDDWLQSAS